MEPTAATTGLVKYVRVRSAPDDRFVEFDFAINNRHCLSNSSCRTTALKHFAYTTKWCT